MELGARLEAAVELLSLNKTKVFADIGSDHAFLAIEVLRRGIAEKAIGADINRMPLEKGRENAQRLGVEMDFILSDGFDNLEGLGVTAAAICGMGGELIAGMLLRSTVARECTLVLQPMSAQEELRRALWDNGFCIEAERFVVEGGKPYTVMLVFYDGIKRDYDYLDLYLGKERPNCPEFEEYKKKIQAAARKRRLGLVARMEDTADIDRLICI